MAPPSRVGSRHFWAQPAAWSGCVELTDNHTPRCPPPIGPTRRRARRLLAHGRPPDVCCVYVVSCALLACGRCLCVCCLCGRVPGSRVGSRSAAGRPTCGAWALPNSSSTARLLPPLML
eukprot:2891236-Prymnesium_polylepis.1